MLGRLPDERHGLADPLDSLAQAFLDGIDDLLDVPWHIAEFDFIYPQARGHRPADFEQQLQYSRPLQQLAANDSILHREMVAVNSLLKPPCVLREPELAGRVTEIIQVLPNLFAMPVITRIK